MTVVVEQQQGQLFAIGIYVRIGCKHPDSQEIHHQWFIFILDGFETEDLMNLFADNLIGFLATFVKNNAETHIIPDKVWVVRPILTYYVEKSSQEKSVGEKPFVEIPILPTMDYSGIMTTILEHLEINQPATA